MDSEREDSDEVLVSAIEHFSYCPRQCALIHVEQTFEENLFTVRGRQAHERVDAGHDEREGDVRVMRGVPLWSERLRLRGKADVVELRPAGPYPVEYKSGPRRGIHADLQLCGQALCLEEMFDVPVPRGAIFHHASRLRREVVFDDSLRRRTLAIVEEIRRMQRSDDLPPAVNDARCRNCSLIDACLPAVLGESARLRGLQGSLFQPASVEPDDA